jgi:hypothetical protein
VNLIFFSCQTSVTPPSHETQINLLVFFESLIEENHETVKKYKFHQYPELLFVISLGVLCFHIVNKIIHFAFHK